MLGQLSCGGDLVGVVLTRNIYIGKEFFKLRSVATIGSKFRC